MQRGSIEHEQIIWPELLIAASQSISCFFFFFFFIALYDGRICQWEGTIIKHI